MSYHFKPIGSEGPTSTSTFSFTESFTELDLIPEDTQPFSDNQYLRGNEGSTENGPLVYVWGSLATAYSTGASPFPFSLKIGYWGPFAFLKTVAYQFASHCVPIWFVGATKAMFFPLGVADAVFGAKTLPPGAGWTTVRHGSGAGVVGHLGTPLKRPDAPEEWAVTPGHSGLVGGVGTQDIGGRPSSSYQNWSYNANNTDQGGSNYTPFGQGFNRMADPSFDLRDSPDWPPSHGTLAWDYDWQSPPSVSFGGEASFFAAKPSTYFQFTLPEDESAMFGGGDVYGQSLDTFGTRRLRVIEVQSSGRMVPQYPWLYAYPTPDKMGGTLADLPNIIQTKISAWKKDRPTPPNKENDWQMAKKNANELFFEYKGLFYVDTSVYIPGEA